MRVLFINHTAKKSGAGISLGTLVRNFSAAVQPHFLLRRGSEVDEILGVGDHPAMHVRFISQTMTTMYGQGLPFWQFAWQLVKAPYSAARVWALCRRWKIEVVHINETTLLADAWGAAWAGVPVFIHARTACLLRPFERHFLEATGRLSAVRFLAIDGEVRESLPAVCRKTCEVVHNPITLGPPPESSEVEALRSAWGVKVGGVVVGQAASLHPEKGVWEILDLAAATRGSLPDAKFVLVGDPSAPMGIGPQLAEAIRSRALGDRVVLAGYESRLALVYGAFDIALCLFGGGLGGVGRAAYEAGLSGKPLVATLPDPARSTTLEDGVSGLLFTPDDHQGIRAAIERLVADAGRRKSLGEAARAALSRRHDPREVAARVEAIYQDSLR